MWSSKQAQFDEHVFPFRKRSIVDKFQRDNSIDILFQAPSDIKRAPYNRLHSRNYTGVHYDTVSNHVIVMHVNASPNTFVRVTQKQCNKDILDLLKVAAAEHYHDAYLAVVPHHTLKGLDQEINPDPPQEL
jgi:hypothetical protein